MELHHDVENPLAFDFDTAGALVRAQPALFEGQPCWHFAPEDELLFLCLHGVRHRFERLSLILDLCHAFRRLQPPAAREPVTENEQQRSLLTLGLAMARRFDPKLEPLAPLHSSKAQKRHLEALAGRLWHELLRQGSQVLDWQSLHAFYVEMELPRDRIRRRIRHLRILAERLIALIMSSLPGSVFVEPGKYVCYGLCGWRLKFLGDICSELSPRVNPGAINRPRIRAKHVAVRGEREILGSSDWQKSPVI